MERKKSFVFYLDWCRLLLEDMPDVMRYKVLDALLRYALSGEEPDEVDVRSSAFSLMKYQLDRDAKRYEERCLKNKENANERWQKERTDATVHESKQTDANECEPNQTDANAHESNQTDANNADNETEIETEIEKNIVLLDSKFDEKDNEPLNKRKEKFRKDVSRYFGKYHQDTLNAFINYWTEPTTDGTQMRFELEKTWNTGKRLANFANREWVPKNSKSANNELGPF